MGLAFPKWILFVWRSGSLNSVSLNITFLKISRLLLLLVYEYNSPIKKVAVNEA